MEDVGSIVSQKGTFKGVPDLKVLEEKILSDTDVRRFLELRKGELRPEALKKGMSALFEYLTRREEIQHPKENQVPTLEPFLDVHNGFIIVNYRRTQEAILREKEQKRKQLVRSINMPKNIAEARFQSAAITSERQEVLQELLNFIQNYIQSPNEFHQGLYLVGPFGVGKTFLMGALANELSENGVETTLINVSAYSAEMKRAIKTNTVEEKLLPIQNTPILVLDDIGAEMNSAWFRDEVLMVILQHRMSQELPTFFTSNFTIEQLEEHLANSTNGNQELLKAKRLIERIRFLAKEYFLDGKNRRNPS